MRAILPGSRKPKRTSGIFKNDTTKELLDLANESAKTVRGVFLTFMLVSLYLAILVGSTTHKQLLLESSIPLPLMQVHLPIVWIYVLSPWIYVVFHWNLLQLLQVQSCKLQAIKLPDGKERLLRLFPLPFSIWQTHAYDNRFFHWLFDLFIHVSTVLLPLGLLVWMQIRFLPYHDETITWLCHRLPVTVDLVLLWIVWPKIKNPEWQYRHVFRSGLTVFKPFLMFLLSSVLLVCSFVIATYPDEWIDRFPIYFNGKKLQQWFPEKFRNLVVTDEILVKESPSQEILAAYIQQKKTEEEAWSNHAIGVDLSNRDLRYGVFTRSKFYNAQFIKQNKDGDFDQKSAAQLDRAIFLLYLFK